MYIGGKNNVNVYRFCVNTLFLHFGGLFSQFPFLLFQKLREQKSAISGTLLKEDEDIALRMLSVNLITFGLCFFTLR